MFSITRKLKSFIITIALTAAFATSAAAATKVCGKHAKLTDFLKKKYSENPVSFGISSSGKSVMEVYTSPSGTWTVLITTAQGVSCIMAAGHSWQERDKLAYLPKS